MFYEIILGINSATVNILTLILIAKIIGNVEDELNKNIVYSFF